MSIFRDLLESTQLAVLSMYNFFSSHSSWSQNIITTMDSSNFVMVYHCNFHLNYDEIQSKTWCSIFAIFIMYWLKIHRPAEPIGFGETWGNFKFNSCQYGKITWWNYALRIYANDKMTYYIALAKREKIKSNSIHNILPATVMLRHSSVPYKSTAQCIYGTVCIIKIEFNLVYVYNWISS